LKDGYGAASVCSAFSLSVSIFFPALPISFMLK
jgi:hypothetical protein